MNSSSKENGLMWSHQHDSSIQTQCISTLIIDSLINSKLYIYQYIISYHKFRSWPPEIWNQPDHHYNPILKSKRIILLENLTINQKKSLYQLNISDLSSHLFMFLPLDLCWQHLNWILNSQLIKAGIYYQFPKQRRGKKKKERKKKLKTKTVRTCVFWWWKQSVVIKALHNLKLMIEWLFLCWYGI